VPSSAIDQHGSVNVWRELRRDFIEMHLHHFGVYRGQDQANGHVAARAECAEDIGVFVTRVDGRTQADSLASPASRPRTFLPYSAFVLTPDFDDFVRMRRLDFADDLGEFFLNASIASASCFGCVGRAVI
jgi:hypothetical protein